MRPTLRRNNPSAATSPNSRQSSPSSKLTCALEGRARRAAVEIAVERRPRRHYLEYSDHSVQAGADHHIGRGEVFPEQPRAVVEGPFKHIEYLRRVAPTGGERRYLQLGEDLQNRRLDAARSKEQPVQVFRPGRVAERR